MKLLHILYTILSLFLKLSVLSIVVFIVYISLPIKTTETVSLPKGSITKAIEYLKKEGYSVNTIDTYILAYLLKQPKSGTLIIGEGSMSRISFLKKLSSAKEAIDIVTLIPGETLPIFLEELAKKQDLSLSKLEKAYFEYSPYKEAGIIPDTYHIAKDTTEQNLIKNLVKQSEIRYEELAIKHLKKYDKKEWLRVLTIASIVQKEAANKEEMPIVASVIYNRLKKDMALQMDGTLNYGKYSHIKVTPKRIKTDTSKFNTYANKGLPPYPICSVSTTAIEATLKPDKTNYLYFMKNKSGVHDFTHSYKEHLRNIQKAKAK
jgi:UPF0755 protein